MSAIVHFEIPFDDAERARNFYTGLFGWKVEKAPGMEYWTIATQEGTYDGMMKRFNPDQKITDYASRVTVFKRAIPYPVRSLKYPREWPDCFAQYPMG